MRRNQFRLQQERKGPSVPPLIAQIGTRYLLTLKAMDCSTGNSLASTEAEARDKNHVLDALGKIASEIRRKAGVKILN
jgi:hypothetical protein